MLIPGFWIFSTSYPISPISPISPITPIPLQGSNRMVYNFNQGWRYHLGDAAGAEAADFNDARWEVVCAPHTARLEPSEASGGRNYQGIIWYRKHFTMPTTMQGKDVTLYFEAIMGKQDIYVNGRKALSHLGGYLPIIINLSDLGVKAGDECVIAVKADNSDDNRRGKDKGQDRQGGGYDEAEEPHRCRQHRTIHPARFAQGSSSMESRITLFI